MSQHQTPVPQLDLAPKLKRPLSFWNPLDYLRLLYWVFFFPQALRWYVETFGNTFVRKDEMTWQTRWEWLRQNPIQLHFFLQGLVLTVVTPLIVGLALQAIGIAVNWPNLAFGVALGMAGGVAGGVVGGVARGVAFSVAFGAASGVAFGVAFGAAFGVAGGVAVGAAFGAAGCVATSGIRGGVALGMAEFMARFMVLGLAGGVAGGVVGGVAFVVANGLARFVVLAVAGGAAGGTAGGVAFVVGLGMAILRPENWVLSLLFVVLQTQNESWQFSRITPLPQIYLCFYVKKWLRQDWEMGLDNVNQLLKYTFQFIPVIKAVNRVLAEISPDQVIFRVTQLAEAPYDWDLVRFASASLSENMKSETVAGFFLLPRPWKGQIQARLLTELRTDTPARAAAAGFWYLYTKEPAEAVAAFAVVRSLPYGAELLSLAETLAVFSNIESLNDLMLVELSAPPQEPLLRPATWKVIASLRRVTEDSRAVVGSVSRSTRSFALNRALGELKSILDTGDRLPQAERGLILNIAEALQELLLKVATEVGQTSITGPVRNPYVVGDPVQGSLFVGREDTLRQLEELWVLGNQLQSVVLFGHRRMGKTSILKNVANRLGSGVKVAYINSLILVDISQGVGEVLMAISDEISRTVNLPPPADADLLNLPTRTFERYLKQVEANLTGGLIIALDEFEKIEELIEADTIPKDFMGVLRGMVQMSPRIAFAFAGLHTLEEMTADYFHPFFASVIPIKVSFIERAPIGYLLANPDDDFPLDYKPEALDLIYKLTAGQPYLVQLIGFGLVRRYNDQVFEIGHPREPVFTVDDVATVINDPEFFQRGRYYFTGVWDEAAQGAAHQQAILKALAPHPEGLSREALAETVGIDETTLGEALKTLTRHDVIKENESRWRIIVELFRRWVLDYA